MEIRPIDDSSVSEMLGDYSGLMLRGIRELTDLIEETKRRARKDHCGIVYSTEEPLEALGLKAAMTGVYEFFASPEIEGVVPEFKQTETQAKWHYGVDVQWF